MTRIMFVCHGNICRSPMAEFIFKRLVSEKGAGSDFYISSSATSTEEILSGVGNPVYPPARDELLKHGIDCTGKRAVQLRRSDYESYDLFIGMDSANIRNMHRILGGDPECKIRKMMTFAGSDRDVADPWYSGNFAVTYNDIYAACTGLLSNLTKQYILRRTLS